MCGLARNRSGFRKMVKRAQAAQAHGSTLHSRCSPPLDISQQPNRNSDTGSLPLLLNTPGHHRNLLPRSVVSQPARHHDCLIVLLRPHHGDPGMIPIGERQPNRQPVWKFSTDDHSLVRVKRRDLQRRQCLIVEIGLQWFHLQSGSRRLRPELPGQHGYHRLRTTLHCCWPHPAQAWIEQRNRLGAAWSASAAYCQFVPRP